MKDGTQIQPSGEHRPLTVLIVDDTVMIRKLITALLQKSTFQVIEASDGKEALAKVHATPPDVILCDLSMPVMDGYEFLRQMKLNDSTRQIPIAILSADSNDEQSAELMKNGAAAICDKMSNGKALEEVILRLANRAPKTP